MHFFLDESGPFIPLGGDREKVSVVGALTLPTYKLVDIYAEYLDIRPALSFRGGEPKGSAQSEDQVAQVIRILSSHDAVLEVRCIDAGLHDRKDIEAFRDRQAAMLFEDLPDTESEETKRIVYDLRSKMKRLAPQLFVQYMLYVDVVERALRHSTLYYAQRDPRELDTLSWTVDGKGDRETALEYLWSELIRPVMQTKGGESPFPYIEGADYSHFSKFEVPHPHDPEQTVVDLRAVFERLNFRDSREELGLELVDIAVSALTRAFNGRLEQDGWGEIGTLIIHRSPQSIPFARLSPREEDHGVLHERHSSQARVVEAVESKTKSMLSNANLRTVLGPKY